MYVASQTTNKRILNLIVDDQVLTVHRLLLWVIHLLDSYNYSLLM